MWSGRQARTFSNASSRKNGARLGPLPSMKSAKRGLITFARCERSAKDAPLSGLLYIVRYIAVPIRACKG